MNKNDPNYVNKEELKEGFDVHKIKHIDSLHKKKVEHFEQNEEHKEFEKRVHEESNEDYHKFIKV